jgi:hypothetical protein
MKKKVKRVVQSIEPIEKERDKVYVFVRKRDFLRPIPYKWILNLKDVEKIKALI